jgi:hypothetical protein
VRGDAEERVRRVVGDRDPVAGTGERARAEEDEVVGASAEDDVLWLDARVGRDGALPAITPGRAPGGG